MIMPWRLNEPDLAFTSPEDFFSDVLVPRARLAATADFQARRERALRVETEQINDTVRYMQELGLSPRHGVPGAHVPDGPATAPPDRTMKVLRDTTSVRFEIDLREPRPGSAR